jgi:hypothetical protein
MFFLNLRDNNLNSEGIEIIIEFLSKLEKVN